VALPSGGRRNRIANGGPASSAQSRRHRRTIQTHPSGLKDANAWLAGGNLEILKVIPLLETWLQSRAASA
jgi:hypothetical protein